MDTGQVVSHYEILSFVGGGGMGVVYEARDLKLGRLVALKFLPIELSRDEEANARFMQEAKAASALDHPNICTIHEIGEAEDGRLFIAMTLYGGTTLKSHLADHGAMNPHEAVDLARQVAHGLAAAHDHSIVHRDVKPANIMITEDGLVKVLDFGLAKLAGGLALTRSGSTLGTTHYMAPEQIRGEVVDARSDLWSLGVVLYEMLVGKRPFEGDYEQSVTYAVLNESPERLISGSNDLSRVVEKLLEKEPSRRYQSAAALVSDLKILPEAKQDAEEAPSKPVPIATRAMAVVSGAVVLVVVLLWVLFAPMITGDRSQQVTDVNTIAVMPFVIRGNSDLEYLGEGLVDLLSMKLDGAGELATVDPNALLGTIVKDKLHIIDPVDALKLARKLGAGRAILGRVTQVGDEIQLSASVYLEPESAELEAVTTVKREDGISGGVDDLSREIARGLFDEAPEQITTLATVTTESFPALKAFLQGERDNRRARFGDALEHFKKAVEEDSTFALAWARLSWAAGWSIDVELEQEGLRRAMLNKETLPSRARQTVEIANYAFRLGQPEQAVELARSILATRPNDLIVLQLLGETLYHYNPYLGRSESESKEYFERALALAPDHGESIPHLIQIALEERDFQAADSLSLLHLRVSNDRSFRDTYTRLHSIAHRTPGDSTWAFLERGNEYPLAELGRIAPLTATALEDMDAVVRIASTTVEAERIPETRRQAFLVVLSIATAAKGQLKAWDDYLESPDDEFYGLRLLVGATLYSLPIYPVTHDDLAELYRQLVGWDTLTHPIVWRGKKIHVGKYGIIQDYLAGITAQRMGEEALLDMHLGRIRSRADSTVAGDLATSFVRLIEAVRMWRRGDLERATKAIEDARLRILWRHTHESALTEQGLNRFVKAELLMATGRLDESLDAYRSLVTLEYATGLIFLGPSYIRQAEIYEELGDHAKAIEYYSRLIKLWKDCDPELIPIRNEAEANLDRLMAETVREPIP